MFLKVRYLFQGFITGKVTGDVNVDMQALNEGVVPKITVSQMTIHPFHFLFLFHNIQHIYIWDVLY